MSDYLTNLATKSFDLTEVLQPLLPSLFQTQGATNWSIAELGFHGERINGEQATDEALFNSSSSVLPLARDPARSQQTEPRQIPRNPDHNGDKQSSVVSTPAVFHPRQLTDQKRPEGMISLELTEPMPEMTLSKTDKASRIIVSPETSKPPQAARLPDQKESEKADRNQRSVSLIPATNEVRVQAPPGTLRTRQTQPTLESDLLPPLIERLAPEEQAEPSKISGPTLVIGQATRPLPRPVGVTELKPTPVNSHVLPTNTQEREEQPTTERPKSSDLPQSKLTTDQPISLPNLTRGVTEPLLTPYVEPMIESREPNVSERPTPTVNVTIGRIEVRATTPPASTSKRLRKTPPVMSLEEYLLKRSTGGEG